MLEFSQTCIQHDKYSRPIKPSLGKRYHYNMAWPHENLWLGVTVCQPDKKHKIDTLRQINAAVRFISLEPLLADMGELDLTCIQWVILGGESGPGARLCELDWMYKIVDQCKDAKVPVFVKQIHREYKATKNTYKFYLEKDITKFPKGLQIRQYPKL